MVDNQGASRLQRNFSIPFGWLIFLGVRPTNKMYFWWQRNDCLSVECHSFCWQAQHPYWIDNDLFSWLKASCMLFYLQYGDGMCIYRCSVGFDCMPFFWCYSFSMSLCLFGIPWQFITQINILSNCRPFFFTVATRIVYSLLTIILFYRFINLLLHLLERFARWFINSVCRCAY